MSRSDLTVLLDRKFGLARDVSWSPMFTSSAGQRSARFVGFTASGASEAIPRISSTRGKSHLHIGRGNVFREFVTVNRGTEGGGGLTAVGDYNLFMAYSHVAHDSRVGNDVIMANAATLAGHVLVEDHSTIGAFSAVHQFCRVGPHAFIGGFS